MTGVHRSVVGQEIISGNRRIVTAGTVDCHVHLICPQIISNEALPRAPPRSSAVAPDLAEGYQATSHSRRVAPGPDAGVTGRLAGELRCSAVETP